MKIKDLQAMLALRNEGKSIYEIAELLDKSASTVYYHTGRGRIGTHTYTDEMTRRVKGLYEEDGLSIRQVADALGLSRSIVRTYLKIGNVAPRGKGAFTPYDSEQTRLFDQRCYLLQEALGLEAAAAELSLSVSTVRRRARRHFVRLNPDQRGVKPTKLPCSSPSS